LLPAFSFDQIGAKEKAWQKEKRRKRISPPAGGDRRFAAGARKTFEKVLSKLSIRVPRSVFAVPPGTF